MGRISADAERDVYMVNLTCEDLVDENCAEGSNDSRSYDCEVITTPSDPARQAGRGKLSGSFRVGPNFAPVRLSSASDLGGSIGGSARVNTHITTVPKPPAWCDRQSAPALVPGATNTKGGTTPRGRSPTGGVVRRASAPGFAPAPRCPTSPQAPTPRNYTPSSPQVLNDSGLLNGMKGDVSTYVRLRPGNNEEVCAFIDGANGVRLRQSQAPRTDTSEAVYRCDHTFGPEASNEDVYQQSVTPICDAVIRGYNGAVIAYGQTGSGKTHTMIGGARGAKGIAPRAVTELFSALEKRPNWTVEVSVLEIYNERVRDLLAPATGPGCTAHVDVHEHCANEQNVSFRCPDATLVRCARPEDALAALTEGMKRRETARTDMNHTSSRSHLIFTVCTTQSDYDMGATLRGRLHLVDLAGSERLKRSMSSGGATFRTPSLTPRTPRDQRREAGEINKSLSQLALVIQRLTGPTQSSLQYVPYRDSMLTRLLAESFGGSSKTCLIITCSALSRDREETRCSLDFGRRAKLVKNKAEINLEVTHEPTPVMQAMVQKEIQELQLQRQAMLQEREVLLADRRALQQKVHATQELTKEAANDAVSQQALRFDEARQHEDEKALLQQRHAQTLSEAKESQVQSAQQVADLQSNRIVLHSRLIEAAGEISRLKQEKVAAARQHEEEIQRFHKEAAEQVKQLEIQKAQTAAFRAESNALRDRWLEDVTKLEAEKATLAAKAEEEKAALRQGLADTMALLARQQEAQASVRLGSAAVVEEAFAAAQVAEQEGASIIAHSSERLAGLREQLEITLTENAQSDQLRKARLTDLEAEQLELKHKWRRAVERFTESDPTDREAELARVQPQPSPCLPSRSENFQVGLKDVLVDLNVVEQDADADATLVQSPTSQARCLRSNSMESHSPEPPNKLRGSPVPELRGSPVPERERSVEPVPGWTTTGTLSM